MPVNKKITQPTKPLRDRLCDLIKRGTSEADAVRVCGIRSDLYLRWAARADDGEQPYLGFFQEITLAKIEYEARIRATVEEEARDNWLAARWLLERLYPNRYNVNAPASSRNHQSYRQQLVPTEDHNPRQQLEAQKITLPDNKRHLPADEQALRDKILRKTKENE